MARACTVCRHPQRASIDSAVVAGGAFDAIEAQFHVSRFALARHKSHVVELVALSSKVEKIAKADNLVDDILELTRHAGEILEEARKVKDLKTALSAIGTLKSLLEFRAQVSGALKPHQTNNLHLHLGGERGLDDKLEQLIDRARLFKIEQRGEGKTLPASIGA
ncbi:MAG TPA: hypothetical protein VGH37_00350 [Candidatus Acidoferrum sp.]|jgi:hypothetical protein